jgi:hypothetical protein
MDICETEDGGPTIAIEVAIANDHANMILYIVHKHVLSQTKREMIFVGALGMRKYGVAATLIREDIIRPARWHSLASLSLLDCDITEEIIEDIPPVSEDVSVACMLTFCVEHHFPPEFCEFIRQRTPHVRNNDTIISATMHNRIDYIDYIYDRVLPPCQPLSRDIYRYALTCGNTQTRNHLRHRQCARMVGYAVCTITSWFC